MVSILYAYVYFTDFDQLHIFQNININLYNMLNNYNNNHGGGFNGTWFDFDDIHYSLYVL